MLVKYYFSRNSWSELLLYQEKAGAQITNNHSVRKGTMNFNTHFTTMAVKLDGRNPFADRSKSKSTNNGGCFVGAHPCPVSSWCSSLWETSCTETHSRVSLKNSNLRREKNSNLRSEKNSNMNGFQICAPNSKEKKYFVVVCIMLLTPKIP